MKKIEKILSRDMTIIDMHAWRLALTTGLKKWLGWSYSDLIFYYHDNYSDVMLATAEHYGEFLNFVLEKIDAQPNWFGNEYKKFLQTTKKFNDFFAKSKKQLIKKIGSQKIATIYKDYCDLMSQNFGPFVVMKWLPIWLEENPELSLKYKKEIELAIDARKKSEQMLPQGRELCDKLVNKISNSLKTNHALNNFIDAQDFFEFLKSRKVPDPKKLNQRTRGFICTQQGIALIDNNPLEAKKVLANLGYGYEVGVFKNTVEVKGQPAHKGIARGIAHLIMTKKEITEIKEGEILITSMTTPEYLSAMKKSAAFVTDEGGITCHAAIVAREMDKPCIIGTKTATTIFKSGDLIEVDANTGLVRKIK